MPTGKMFFIESKEYLEMITKEFAQRKEYEKLRLEDILLKLGMKPAAFPNNGVP